MLVPVLCPSDRLKFTQIFLEFFFDIYKRNIIVAKMIEPTEQLLGQFGCRLKNETILFVTHQFR